MLLKRVFLWSFAVLVPGILLAAPQARQTSAAANARPGYLISLRLQASTLTAVAVADIENYVENRHIRSDDDWQVLLLDRGGSPIGRRLLRNPYTFSPLPGDNQAIPLTIKVPAPSALAAIVVQDQHEQERLRLPVDDAFRSRAAAERARFLAHDGENRRLVRERAERRQDRPEGGQAAKGRPPVRMETLPPELRNRVVADTAAQMGSLRGVGPGAVNAAVTPPLPPELATLAAGAVLADELTGPFTVSGLVTDATNGAPLVNAAVIVLQYTPQPGYVGGDEVYTNSEGRYSCPIAEGYIRVLGPVGATGYVQSSWWSAVSGSLAHDIQTRPGVVLSGRVLNQQAEGVSGVQLQWSAAGDLAGGASSDGSGGYSLLVPANTSFTLTVASVPQPYLVPSPTVGLVVSADTVWNITLSTGHVIQGLVSGDGGAPVSGASVLVRQIVATSSMPSSWSHLTNVAGRFSVTVPRNLFPNDFVVSVYASGYVRSTAALTVSGDVTHDVPLARGVTVAGMVTDSAGTPQNRVHVRALLDGNLVLSTLTDAAGAYSLTLAPGTYDLAAVPSGGRQMASVTVPDVTVNGATTQHFALPSLGGSVSLKLYCGTTSAGCGTFTFARLELRQGTQTIAAFVGKVEGRGREVDEIIATVLWDPVAGQYYYSASAAVAPGQYDVVATVLGLAPVTFPGVQVTGDVTLTATLPPPLLWTGTLRGGDGAPIPGVFIYSYDDTVQVWATSTTDASGRFSVRMTPGGFIEFSTNEGTRNIYHTERFGNVAASRNADCVLDSFPAFTDTGSPLTQMYGVADRTSRWNLVMIGDGYTDVHETYTDVNGNGQWDGVVFYDLNRDGVWNAEPYWMYGAAPYPSGGTNPTLANEPFGDVNGDGVLSTDDQALFDRNTLDIARSLFGADVWRDHRTAFNIFRIRVISAQAGHDVRDINDNTVVSRNTALGVYLDHPDIGWMFWADDSLVSQYINQYLPEADTRIVFVNQPVHYMGRPNSYMFSFGGDIANLSNGPVAGHELAHKVGGLADEYTGSSPTYTDAEFSAANVTALSTPDTIPWRSMLTPGKEIPSVPYSGGVGLYEGAAYTWTGKYRATQGCVMGMSTSARFCPVCTNELEIRLSDIGVPVPVATLLSPVNRTTGGTPALTWQAQPGVSHYLLEVESQSGGQLVASFDVYATSFTLTPPLPAGTYRWRLRAGSTTNWGDWSDWSLFTVTVNPPAISAVSPARGSVAGGTQVSISGSNFLVGATTVTIGGQPATNVAVAGDDSLTAVVPGGPVGTTDVVVSTFAGTATASGAFTYYLPFYRYLAEGATHSGFDVTLALLNTESRAAACTLTFQRGGARPVQQTLTVPARTRRTVFPKTITGLAAADFSTRLECDADVVMDRTMFWSYGAHAETAVAGPAATWYLAEGATHSGFDLYYLIQNPNGADVTVDIEFLLPGGTVMPHLQKVVRANSRETVYVDGVPGLVGTDVSAIIRAPAATPVIVERAMYQSRGRLFESGHDSAGVTAPQPSWFLAEGATHSGFAEYLLVANPNAQAAEVEIQYLLGDGSNFTVGAPQDPRLVLAPKSRLTIDVGRHDPRLAAADVSAVVRELTGQGIIVERAMWWPGNWATWYEAHNSAGSTTTGNLWALADGLVGGPLSVSTYVLVANTSAVTGRVRATLVFEDGTTAATELTVPAHSRANFNLTPNDIGRYSELAPVFPPAIIAVGKRFGVIVESLGPNDAQIVVERAMYWNTDGQVWGAGTNAIATKLR